MEAGYSDFSWISLRFSPCHALATLSVFLVSRKMASFLGLLSLGRKPSAGREILESAARPATPAAQASPLLKHVLVEDAANDAPPKPAEPKSITEPLSHRLSVGARLADARTRTIDAA